MYIAFGRELIAVRTARGAISASLSSLVLRFLGVGFTSASSAPSSWLSHSCSFSSSSLPSTAAALRFLEGVLLVGAAFFLGAEGFFAAPVDFSTGAFSSAFTVVEMFRLREDVRGGILKLAMRHWYGIGRMCWSFGLWNIGVA